MEIILERLDHIDGNEFVVETPEFKVGRDEYVIGRANDCHLRLESTYVSRHHCELIRDERHDAVRVRDLGSQNGTFVNQEPVADERELKDGDTLVVGFIPFEVHIRSDSHPGADVRW